MFTTIKGYFEHGKIILTEDPPVKAKSEVMVTFLTGNEKKATKGKRKIILGVLEGKIKTPDNFNDPLDELKDYM